MNPNEIFGSQNNDTGFVTLEEIENSFKTPTQRQDYYEPKQDATQPMGDLGRLADPDGTAFNDFQPVEEETAPVDPEKARRTGERIARMIDTGIDFTLSNFVAKNGESYKADERDLQDIAEAWGEVSAEHNWNIGPEWTLIILYLMVYGPLVKQAFYDRRVAELEARQNLLEQQMKTIQMNQGTQPEPTTDSNGNAGANPTPNPNPNPGPLPFTFKPNV